MMDARRLLMLICFSTMNALVLLEIVANNSLADFGQYGLSSVIKYFIFTLV